MKTLGLVGGIGPESTIAYYRAIIAAGRSVASTAQPPVLINSIDVQKVLRLVGANELTELTDYLVREVEKLARGAADIALIAQALRTSSSTMCARVHRYRW